MAHGGQAEEGARVGRQARGHQTDLPHAGYMHALHGRAYLPPGSDGGFDLQRTQYCQVHSYYLWDFLSFVPQ